MEVTSVRVGIECGDGNSIGGGRDAGTMTNWRDSSSFFCLLSS